MFSDASSTLRLEPDTLASSGSETSVALQILRFVFVGGSSVLLDLLVYLFLASWMNRSLAKGISYLCGMALGYVGNKFWTFSVRRQSGSEAALYVGLYATTLAVNMLLNAGSLWSLGELGVSERVGQLLAFLIATGTTTVMNFVGMKYVCFRPARTAV